MSCVLNNPSGKELLTNSIKEKLSLLESEREGLRNLVSDISDYEVTEEEKEWLLDFLLDKGFQLVEMGVALRAIDNSPLSRFRKNLRSLQDVCDSLLRRIVTAAGGFLNQNYRECVLLNSYLKELEFIDVITYVPEDVLRALSGEQENLSTPTVICLKYLVDFVGEDFLISLFPLTASDISLVEVGDSLLITGYDFNVVKEFIVGDCKTPKSIKTDVDSDADNVSAAAWFVAFISLLIIFFLLKVNSFI